MSAAVPEVAPAAQVLTEFRLRANHRKRLTEFRLRAKHHPLKSSVWDRKVGR